MKITVQRIYDDASTGSALRWLVDRVWPRGVAKEDAALDEWAKDLAPSTDLRKWFDHREDRFEEFSNKYRHELDERDEADELIDQLKKSKKKELVLLYAAKDEKINHAVVLRDYLKEQLK